MWKSSELHRPVGRWEIMTGWADDIVENEGEDKGFRSNGDVLGDVQDSGGRGRRRWNTSPSDIPYEEQWETDMDVFQPGIHWFAGVVSGCRLPHPCHPSCVSIASMHV